MWTRTSFDRAAEFYDETRGLPFKVMKELVKKIKDELCDCRTILDVGVGTGRFAKPMRDNGFEIMGIDISKKMFAKAVDKGVENLVLSDACFIPFKSYSFDSAICIHLLHLIPEWQAALQEICRVTQALMVSIMYGGSDPVLETYDSLAKEFGYEKKRVGKGEWELKDLVKPLRQSFVVSYNREVDKHLNYMERQAYSGQWEIPKDVNRKIVNKLKDQFGGKTFQTELHLLVWDINSIRYFLCNKTILKNRATNEEL